MDYRAALDDDAPDPRDDTSVSGERLIPVRRRGGDLICLSHLRWGLVLQRLNQLMIRFAHQSRVFFVEQPIFERRSEPKMGSTRVREGIHVCVPRLPAGMNRDQMIDAQSLLMNEFCASEQVDPEVVWFSTPMALPWARNLPARVVIYDCVDELRGLVGVPRELEALELELMARANFVFTGGYSLFATKRKLHRSVHLFPSSIDTPHFSRARGKLREPRDQALIPRPRLGYSGVIDERIDLELLAHLARERPELQLVMLGPVAVDRECLPQAANLHWLGMKPYAEVPAYMAGWDVALMPYISSPEPRFVSPTQTLEYLAAGRPVVATAVPDVVHPYGELELVHIADRSSFVTKVDQALSGVGAAPQSVLDRYLSTTSWDALWEKMSDLIDRELAARAPLRASVNAR